jgi:hypothetical protein
MALEMNGVAGTGWLFSGVVKKFFSDFRMSCASLGDF